MVNNHTSRDKAIDRFPYVTSIKHPCIGLCNFDVSTRNTPEYPNTNSTNRNRNTIVLPFFELRMRREMDAFKVFVPSDMTNRKSICRPLSSTVFVPYGMGMVDALKSNFVVERAFARTRTKLGFSNSCRNNNKTVTAVGTG